MKPLLLIFAILLLPSFAQAEEEIASFRSEATLNPDRSVSINETIAYDFGENKKRGIYRIIPGGGIGGFSLGRVLRNGEETPFEIVSQNPLELRIFQEGLFYTGIQTYTIEYTMTQATKYFSLLDINEIAWNVTGTDWSVPIQEVEAIIRIPEKLQDSELQFTCYRGEFGSDDTCEVISEGDIVRIIENNLEANEGITFSLGIPGSAGFFSQPHWYIQNRHSIDRAVSIVVLVFGSIILWWWATRIKGTSVRKPIVRQYIPPKDVTPAQVGFIKSPIFQAQYLSATIVDLARKGYIKIVEQKRKLRSTHYIFEQIKYGDDSLSKLEKELLTHLFHKHTSISTAQLAKENFAKHLSSFARYNYQPLRSFYHIKPSNLWIQTLFLSSVLAILAILTLVLSGQHLGWISVSFGTLASLVWIITMFISPLSPEGAAMKGYVLGYDYYLRHAETHRLSHQEQEHVFFEMLPYAMALGVVHEWARAFKHLSLSQPDWYQGDIRSFSAVAFANHLNATSQSFVTSVGGGASSSSGGGGSVGGGVGGGGGGSI